ncbi:PREDICTED: lariat debranching enzyme isoform X2 [Nicrophorus vespilloides]|uniref:Lariat debranching enzyme isoform X2 n=1 Tax=Nicrophorus vespilloides TaxID=110193 RepID=A0ABM1MZX2_NICVS|nr:PREDICTED: lariat debranching enzyme isoform X2 [Nicrophorus vespilloides]XP_017780122.1 PREDICTED: lariat debranching enzyme isoform X2 [Nicrophorus vespilloides]
MDEQQQWNHRRWWWRGKMKIAVEGCAHGELDNLYSSIQALEEENNYKIDLLICCGDFQSVRNERDLRCMAVPEKYYNMCTFYKYYSGEKKAPILTIFIGGNHEASNYLQELPYGGWVAPNIYYLGYGSVINIGGIRIGGISGIYSPSDYMRGHHEISPYDDKAKRSVYHTRNIEVHRFKQLSGLVDVFISHDWPQDVTDHGDVNSLVKIKPWFKDDISKGKLGSAPCREIMSTLKPKYWFAAHLHCKFAALVEHDDKSTTKFLALDKCLPKRKFLQILDIPSEETGDNGVHIKYDLEWLTILYLTNHLFSVKQSNNYLPSKMGHERWQFTPTEEEKHEVLKMFGDLTVPLNFVKTVDSYVAGTPFKGPTVQQPKAVINAQTTEFCKKLGVIDPTEEILKSLAGYSFNLSGNSENSSYTSVIEDVDVAKDISESAEILSPLKRTGLSLPKPVNAREETEEDESPRKYIKMSDECDDLPQVKETDDANNFTKKFKRRNASLYATEETE